MKLQSIGFARRDESKLEGRAASLLEAELNLEFAGVREARGPGAREAVQGEARRGPGQTQGPGAVVPVCLLLPTLTTSRQAEYSTHPLVKTLTGLTTKCHVHVSSLSSGDLSSWDGGRERVQTLTLCVLGSSLGLPCAARTRDEERPRLIMGRASVSHSPALRGGLGSH